VLDSDDPGHKPVEHGLGGVILGGHLQVAQEDPFCFFQVRGVVGDGEKVQAVPGQPDLPDLKGRMHFSGMEFLDVMLDPADHLTGHRPSFLSFLFARENVENMPEGMDQCHVDEVEFIATGFSVDFSLFLHFQVSDFPVHIPFLQVLDIFLPFLLLHLLCYLFRSVMPFLTFYVSFQFFLDLVLFPFFHDSDVLDQKVFPNFLILDIFEQTISVFFLLFLFFFPFGFFFLVFFLEFRGDLNTDTLAGEKLDVYKIIGKLLFTVFCKNRESFYLFIGFRTFFNRGEFIG
jgi:hypothetical protein